jgi:LmbE family N-acetylglucosaminyl deacetylase
MLPITLDRSRSPALKLLCLGAHSDDIEIGCGGTLLRLVDEFPQLQVDWIVFGSQGYRLEEAYASADEYLKPVEHKNVVVKDYKDGFFPYHGEEIKEYFEQLKQQVSPDIVFTPYRHDLHQDHRLISELTWNTFRNHLIWEYEIPKYDGDLGTPNLFVHLDAATCQRKIEYLLKHFKTQQNRDWFTEDTFLALLRLRGVESKSPLHYAEAFYSRKMVL